MSSLPSRPAQAVDRLQQQRRVVRQPLGVKNTQSPSAAAAAGGEVVMAHEEAFTVKAHSTPPPHLLPPSRQRTPSTIALSSGANSATSIVAPVSTATCSNPRFYTSHYPSPLGVMAEEKGDDGSDQDGSSSSQRLPLPLSPSVVKTPKKRAIPLEDVHVRNTVPGQRQEDAQSLSPNPSKRSRSSKHGSSATDPSTSTSLSIATGLGDVNLQSQGGSVPAPSTVIARPVPAPPLAHPHSHVSRTSAIPHPRPTTTRIDKQSRMTETDRMARERQKTENQREWRKKFLRAFPQFHFHLDGFDQATRVEVTACIEQLGGSIEPFFSNAVTHLVTTRKIPMAAIPEGKPAVPSLSMRTAEPPTGRVARPPTGGPGRVPVGPSRPLASTSRFSRLPSLRKKNTSVPLHSDRNPFEECGPPVPSNDILVKARDLGIKVWTYEKFRTVVASLVGQEATAPTAGDEKKQPNLSQMLEREKVQSALERDPLVARDNFHYFAKSSVYILIEDATMEHRPIMVQEWRKPVHEGEEVPWPVLYGELEGRCPFTKFDFDGDVRRRMKPNRHETLKRSVSLSHLHRCGPTVSPAPSGDSRGSYGVKRGASPYPLASGNSVNITSNIASTTSTAVGGPSGLGLIPPYGALARKMNAATGLGLGRPSAMPSNAVAAMPSHPSTVSGGGDQTRGSLVRRMLGLTEHNRNNLAGMRRSVSTASAGHQMRREKKPGYCENCRIKYDDFDEHITGRKHRKFAEDSSHFTELDQLLGRVGRPMATWAMEAASPEGDYDDEPVGDISSTSSLLAAGGSLLEAGGADEACEQQQQQHCTMASPRNFMHAMQQWQQSTHEELCQYVGSNLEGSAANRAHESILEHFAEHDSTSSHGSVTHTARQATEATATEEESTAMSPDTSPHVHLYHHHHQHLLHHHQRQEKACTPDRESYYGTAL